MTHIECLQGLLLLESTLPLLLLLSHLSCTVDCSLTSRGKSFHLELRIGAVAALVSHF